MGRLGWFVEPSEGTWFPYQSVAGIEISMETVEGIPGRRSSQNVYDIASIMEGSLQVISPRQTTLITVFRV